MSILFVGKIPLLHSGERFNLGPQTLVTIFPGELEAGSWSSFLSLGYGALSQEDSSASLGFVPGNRERVLLLPPGVHWVNAAQ